MLSCASGSTAVVFHLSKIKSIESPALVRSVGGNLILNFDSEWNDVWVEGPAEILFTGNFTLDLISK